jgi:hypothetical protein
VDVLLISKNSESNGIVESGKMPKIVILALILALILIPGVSARPSWITTGAYVKYDQMFSWSGGSQTEPMTWNITSLSGNIAGFQIDSYTYNVTNGQVNFFPGGDAWKVNTDNRNITESSTGVTGLKNPFWIESGVGMGSTVDAYFGTTASIQLPDTIGVLGRNIDCWKVSMNLGPTSTMQRWYDPATGIVLRIDTSTSRDGISMNVRELATASNIAMIGTQSAWLSLWPYFAGIVLVVAAAIAGLLVYRHRRRTQRMDKTRDSRPLARPASLKPVSSCSYLWP